MARGLSFTRVQLSRTAWKKVWRTLDAVYAARSEKELFDLFCERVRPLIAHETAIMFPIESKTNLPSKEGYITLYIPDADGVGRRYGSYYCTLDPAKELVQPHMSNVPMKYTDATSIIRLKDGEYYQDFLKPIRIVNVLGVKLGMDGISMAGIGLHRPPRSRDFTDREKAVLWLLAPHLANALNTIRMRDLLAKDRTSVTSAGSSPVFSAYRLTPREEQTTALALQGLNNCKIAQRLIVTESTVKDHLRSIYKKTGVQSRAGLIVKLLQGGALS